MSIIIPTIGRVVLFRPGSNFTGVAPSDGSPLPALISRVWSDRLINIGGFDADGKPFSATSVPLIQGDETSPVPGNYYAEWMPYQKGQAAKAEALEKQIGVPGVAQAEGRIGHAPSHEHAHALAMLVLGQLHTAGDLRLAVGEDEAGYAKRAAKAYLAAFSQALTS